MKNQLTQFAARSRVLLQRLVRRFGFVLLPIAEINRIEQDGIEYMRAREKHKYGTEDHGYFSGLADYASKKSTELRNRYLPNVAISQPEAKPTNT